MTPRLRLYILVDGVVTPCLNALAWARWVEDHDHQVARTQVGPLEISTVFLGINHDFFGEGPPLVFETMVFGNDPSDEEPDPLTIEIFDAARRKGISITTRDSVVGTTERYSTFEQARRGHEQVVERVFEHLGLRNGEAS